MSKKRALSQANKNIPFEDECMFMSCRETQPRDHGFPLCETHLKKAWAAFEVAYGADVPEPREIAEDRTQLGKHGAVYFVRVGDLLKIGWTSNVAHRISSLSVDAVLHIEPGMLEDERAYHQQFSEHKAHGREWFHLNQHTQKLVDNIQQKAARKHVKV